MEALGLNVADWFILVVLTASGLISLARGFTKEFLSLFLWVVAFVAAVSLEFIATPKITEFIGNVEIAKILSYIVVFMVTIILGGMVIKFISKLINNIDLLPNQLKKKCDIPKSKISARVVCDYIASMTDRSAVENHAILYGKDIMDQPGY